MGASTVHILATILTLLSDNRHRLALPYLIGWVVGTLRLVTVGTIAASSLRKHGRGARTRSHPFDRTGPGIAQPLPLIEGGTPGSAPGLWPGGTRAPATASYLGRSDRGRTPWRT